MEKSFTKLTSIKQNANIHFGGLVRKKEPDSEIWQRFKEGDKAAFKEIYNLYVQDLFDYGVKIDGNRDLVKDCIQELFLELWKSKQKLARVNSIKLYLFKALRWKIIHYKKKASTLDYISPYEAERPQMAEDSCEQQMIDAQTEQAVNRSLASAFDNLPERQKEVIKLIYYEKLTYEEVSTIMSINIKSAYTLVWKALGTLKRHL